MSNRMARIYLNQIAVARSGDKGDHVNIGVIARELRWFDVLRSALSLEVVEKSLGHLAKGGIEIFELPGIGGINIMLYHSLQGGGTVALRLDAQGKTIGQSFLNAVITVPHDFVIENNLNYI